MTQKQSVILKSLLFVAGLGVIVLAFFLFNNTTALRDAEWYMWISIVIMYLVFFCPFFLTRIHTENTAEKMPSLTMIWFGVVFFIIVSTAVTVVVVLLLVPVRVAVIVECVLAFLFAINVYFGYFASSHVHYVEQTETQMLSSIKEIRAAMDLLVAKSSALNDGYSAEREKLSCLAEDVKYLSPVQTGSAVDLEQEILEKINVVGDACGMVLDGSDGLELRKQLTALDMLIRQRKLMKN
ncbi:MAG: hypothetical protein M0P01_11540 [Treponema sp.]|nr:hypothetical protein [Treponema sp.]